MVEGYCNFESEPLIIKTHKHPFVEKFKQFLTMKKYVLLIVPIICAMLTSCQKHDEIIFDHSSIMILQNGELQRAHGNIIHCPRQGGKCIIQIVSTGIDEIYPIEKPSEWVTVLSVPSYPPKKEDMYDSEQNTYLQEILLDIKPNSERESRMCYITVGSGIEELSRASIFIEQD